MLGLSRVVSNTGKTYSNSRPLIAMRGAKNIAVPIAILFPSQYCNTVAVLFAKYSTVCSLR